MSNGKQLKTQEQLLSQTIWNMSKPIPQPGMRNGKPTTSAVKRRRND